MFSVASDYIAFIGLLIGSIVVSTFFESKSVPYPVSLTKEIKDLWQKLIANYNGHLPDRFRQIKSGDWDNRTQDRVKHTMLMIIMYGAFSLFYCCNCCRICCGQVSYTMTPIGIIIDSILVLLYLVVQLIRYGKKETKHENNLRYSIWCATMLLFVFSIAFDDLLVNDISLHEIATISILFTSLFPLGVLWFFKKRNRHLVRKATVLTNQLSCIIDAITVIEVNSDKTVTEKIRGILCDGGSTDIEEIKDMRHELCNILASDGFQYIRGIDSSDNSISFEEYSDEDIKNMSFGNLSDEMISDIKKTIKNHNVDPVRKECNDKKLNMVQVLERRNKIFDDKLAAILDKIPIANDENR